MRQLRKSFAWEALHACILFTCCGGLSLHAPGGGNNWSGRYLYLYAAACPATSIVRLCGFMLVTMNGDDTYSAACA